MTRSLALLRAASRKWTIDQSSTLQEINKALRSPDIQEFFGPTGLIVEGSTPAEYKEFVDKELRKWGDIVRRAGVKVE